MSKMIKEMEELREHYMRCKNDRTVQIVQDCIDIVKEHKKKKKGKCEWIISKYSAYELMLKNDEHNGKLLMFSDYDENPYKYCPYCGKKIKVVDEDWMGYTE